MLFDISADTLGTALSLLAVLVITLFIPGLAIFLKSYIKEQKNNRLEKTEAHFDLKQTEAYKRAVDTVPEIPVSHYTISLLVLSVIIGTCATLMIFGASSIDLSVPNFVLAGARVSDPPGPELETYQTKTMLVIMMAFLGAYVWSIQMVFRRVVTLDLSPGAFQSISIRIIVATLIAAVIRHTYSFGDDTFGNASLVVLGFGAGVFPQLAIGYLREKIKVLWSGNSKEAKSLPLTLIEGISMFDRARLTELGIEDAQNLAHANPIELFIRTPYRLELVIDWVAQAQAMMFLMPVNYTLLRQKLLVRTIFDFQDMLADKGSFNDVVKALDVPEAALRSLSGTFGNKPSFIRLNELRDRMSHGRKRATTFSRQPS